MITNHIQEMLEKLDRATILSELNPQDKGKYYALKCPECGEQKAYIYKNGFQIVCNRQNNCRFSVSLFDYVKDYHKLPTDAAVFVKLSELGGLPLTHYSQEELDAMKRLQEKAENLEKCLTVFQEELLKSQEAQEYLERRGVDAGEALGMGLGYMPSFTLIDKASAGNLIPEFTDDKWAGRIVGLWRNRYGIPVAIWGRSIRDNVKDKYQYTHGERTSPFYVDRFSDKEVILVEGIFDAITLSRNGIQAAALGGNKITEAYLKDFHEAGVKTAILNLHNDDAGCSGTADAIAKLESRGIRTYVIEPSLMDTKDPDEYVRKNGPDAYKSLLKKTQRGVEWQVDRLAKKYDITSPQKKDALLSEAINSLSPIYNAFSLEAGVKKLSSVLSIPEDVITKEIQRMRKNAEEVRRQFSPPIDLDELLRKDIPNSNSIWGDGYIDPKSRTAASGTSKIGKSLFCMNLALCLATGKPFLNIPVHRKVKVLYLQQEISEARFKQRWEKMKASKQILIESGYLKTQTVGGMIITNPERYKQLERWIEAGGYEVVIFDPLYKFHNCEENSAKEMKLVLDKFDHLINKYGISVILIQHHRKLYADAARGSQQIRGSSVLVDWGDSYLILNYKRGENGLITLDWKLRNAEEPDQLNIARNNNLWYEHVGSVGRKKFDADDIIDVVKTFPTNEWIRQQDICNKAKSEKGIASTTARQLLKDAKYLLETKSKGRGRLWRLKSINQEEDKK